MEAQGSTVSKGDEVEILGPSFCSIYSLNRQYNDKIIRATCTNSHVGILGSNPVWPAIFEPPPADGGGCVVCEHTTTQSRY